MLLKITIKIAFKDFLIKQFKKLQRKKLKTGNK